MELQMDIWRSVSSASVLESVAASLSTDLEASTHRSLPLLESVAAAVPL